MKKQALRELSADELKRKLNETRHELLLARLQLATQQLKNPLKIRVLRRQIARILTISKEKGAK